MNPVEFNTWFPAIIGGLVVGLLVAALWDLLRRKAWCFASRVWPGVLKEVGLENSYLSRAEVEEKQREVTDMLSALSTQITRAIVPVQQSMEGAAQCSSSSGSSDCGVICKFDLESQAVSNPAYTGTPITFTATAYFSDDTPSVVIRPTKKFFKRFAKGTVKRWRSSIILQAPMPIESCVLAKIGELARNCMLEDNRCVFQFGNWAILYYNDGEVHLHILKEGDVPVNVEARWQPERTHITMRGLYLNGAQVKVATKHTRTVLRSDGPAVQGIGDLDELHLPTEEVNFPEEDSFIYASKVVDADGISLLVRSEASFILPPQGTFAVTETLRGLLQRISSFAKGITSFFLQAEDRRPETTANLPELRFDHEHLELIVEHWNGVSEVELLDYRKEVLHYLQELQASGIVERACPPFLDSHLIFIRDKRYLDYWHEGLQVLNEVFHRSSEDSHSHTHIRIRGGIRFLLGEFEDALQDLDLAYLNMGGHQSTVLLDRALVKCMLGRYSEAMQDVVAVTTLSPNVNDIQELQACVQQILDQQRAFRIDTQSGPLYQQSLLPDQDNSMVKLPDLLTGDEWHSGDGESFRSISDDGTAGESTFDSPAKRGRSVGVAQAVDWSTASITEALKLQLKLINHAQFLERKPRYHVRRISFVSTILVDEYDPDDVVKPLSAEDQHILNWQASTEDLQNDLEVSQTLILMSARLCPYKNISRMFHSNATDDDSHVQRTGPHPLSSYRHFSCRTAMLTKHSAADGDVETLFLYDGTVGDRSCLRRRSHDYIKLLVLPEERSPFRTFWLLQWDVVDMWHISNDGRGDPDRGLCLNSTDVECQDDSKNFHDICLSKKRKSPWIAEVAAADANALKRHSGNKAKRIPEESIPANDKPQTAPQILPRSGREPGASQYYGVRFRPDLNKWVAEIRVAEWKAVDKKVWLGTFDTEQAAARGVDVARNLVKCRKRRPPNLPCEKLEAYSTTIPPHLIPADLTDTSMFKEVTRFIKDECRKYVISFDDIPREQIISTFDQRDSLGGQFFHPTSSVKPTVQGYENKPASNSSDVLDMDIDSSGKLTLHQYTNEPFSVRDGLVVHTSYV